MEQLDSDAIVVIGIIVGVILTELLMFGVAVGIALVMYRGVMMALMGVGGCP